VSIKIDTPPSYLALYFSYIVLLDVPFWLKLCGRIFIPIKIGSVSLSLFFFIQFVIYASIVTLIGGGDLLLLIIKELWFLLLTIYFYYGINAYGIRYYIVGAIINVCFAIYQFIADVFMGLPSEFYDLSGHYFWNGVSVAHSYFFPIARYAGLALEPAYLSAYIFPLLFVPLSRFEKLLICLGLVLCFSSVTMIALLMLLCYRTFRLMSLEKYCFLASTFLIVSVVYAYSDKLIFIYGTFFDRLAAIVVFKNYNLIDMVFGVGFHNFVLFGWEYYNVSDVLYSARNFGTLEAVDPTGSLSLYGSLLTELGIAGFALFTYLQDRIYQSTIFKNACIIFLFSNLTVSFSTSWPNIPFMVAFFLVYSGNGRDSSQRLKI